MQKQDDYLPSSADTLSVIRLLRQSRVGEAKPTNEFDFHDVLRLWRPLVKSIDDFIQNTPPRFIPSHYKLYKNWKNGDLRLRMIAMRLVVEPYPPNNYKDEWFRNHENLASQIRSGKIFVAANLSAAFSGLDSDDAPAVQFGMAVWSCGYAVHPEWLTLLVEVSEAVSSQLVADVDNVPPAPASSITTNPRTARRREAQLTADFRSMRERNRGLEEEKRAALAEHIAGKSAFDANAERYRVLLLKLETRISKQGAEIDALGGQLSRRSDALAQEVTHSKSLLGQVGNARSLQADLVRQLGITETKLRKAKSDLASVLAGSAAVYAYIAKEVKEADLAADVSQGEPRRRAVARRTILKKFQEEFLVLEPSFRQSNQPPVHRPRKFPLKFESLGGGNEIGASCYLLTVGEDQVLIDAGMRINKGLDDLWPDLSRWSGSEPQIEAVILTHAHGDHSGALPLLARQWEFDIYCTIETSKILPIMLEDSFNNLQRKVAEASVNAQYLRTPAPQLPYVYADKESVERRMRPMYWRENKAVGQLLNFQFLPAGHILGAASILFEGWGRRVLVTGDYSTFLQETVSPADWSEITPGSIDLLVSEATYGLQRPRTRDEEVEKFLFLIRSTLAKRGSVLVPSFALGRAQEVLSIIRLAFSRGTLAPCPVWIDGLIDRINPIYEAANGLITAASFRNRRPNWQIPEVINELAREPGIVITTSGMLAGGPVVQYAKLLLPDPKNQLILVGYQDPESPGGKIKNATSSDAAQRVLDITDENGKQTKVKLGSPAVSVALSAHSDQLDMVAAIKRIAPRHVVLVHGEEDNRTALAVALRSEGLDVEVQPSIVVAGE